ncbi:lytic polysaccharide monooxygenase [Streptomyces sp. NPDC002889]|uniref:lytic polysaccharide monooxygenase auxiliary activity family 9 protein n=1 Tax=Streptomyces sp. NPDC002889 TaxID=3364669 RepID=UPI0036A8677C
MTDHRPPAAAAVAAVLVGAVPVLLTLAAAGVAQAHGAPTDPVSRVAACGLDGAQRTSAACRAARAVNGGADFSAWDNLRVADVRGRDREVIPDGQLCSAGLDAYKGLDIARTDWPATPLKAGAPFTLTYRSTIPHRGTFNLYLTKQGHDPATPLRWDDLAARPFATATDPALVNGAYRISGRLPSGLTGRHVLYTVWRNTDTPDTYYSCSDVVLTGGSHGEGDAPPRDTLPQTAQPSEAPPSPPADRPTEQPSEPQGTAEAAAPAAPPVDPSAGRPATASADGDDNTLTLIAGSGAAVLALLAVTGSAMLRRRRT